MNNVGVTAVSCSPSVPGLPQDRSRESERLLRIALERALERIADRELDAIRAAELRGERPTFGDVLEHYRATRFLYSAKLEQLGPRISAIEATWNRLIVADGAVFKIFRRHLIEDDRLVTGTSICAFEYAPSCWLVQHLVSARRHELTGTLAVCLGMASWVGRTSADAALRFTYRDSNPGVARLFGSFDRFLPDICLETRRCAYALLDPGHADPGVELPSGVTIAEVDRRLAPAVVAFYQRLGHRVGVRALHLDDPHAPELAERYRRHGLERRRRVLAALRGDRVVGAVVCHESSPGINFSFFENAIELLEVEPELQEPAGRAILKHLVSSALRGRQLPSEVPVALLCDLARAPLARAAELLPEAPKEYIILTMRLADGGQEAVRRALLHHYRELFTEVAAADGAGS